MSKHKDDHYSEDKLKKYKMDRAENLIFRTLSVGFFSPRLDDEDVKSIIYKEFRKFGEYMICVMKNPSGLKFAHTQFRYYEDAMSVRMAHKNKDLDFEPSICVEIVHDEYTRERKVYPQGMKTSSPSMLKMDYRAKEYPLLPEIPPGKGIHRGERHYTDDADDKNATRTLFIGNLDYDITTDELATIFGRFGVVEDIDIKRSNLPMHLSVYAFIRFLNLEMAKRAKAEMSGQYIRKFQCRIGYGKHVPSNCLWVGGLGSQTTKEDLEKCFNSYNPLKIEWPYGRLYAYIVFSTMELATTVLNTLQGYEINSGCFIRLDYSDENHIAMLMGSSSLVKSQDDKIHTDTTNHNAPTTSVANLNPNPVTNKPPMKVFDVIPPNLKALLCEVDNTRNLLKYLQVVWEGDLLVKASNFPVKMYIQCGHARLIDDLLKNLNKTTLTFDKLLSLDSHRVTEIRSYINCENSDCGLLIVAPANDVQFESNNIKPFKTLLTYLKKKHSIGLTLLEESPPNGKYKGAIHWFSPGPFSKDLIQVLCPKIPDDCLMKPDYLFTLLSTVNV